MQPQSRWIAGHYGDEFCEAHAKSLVVRSAFGSAIPAAGVGCGFVRSALAELAAERQLAGESGPFAAGSLTEDYELGLILASYGRRGRFVRVRDDAGGLVATRSFFPSELGAAVRQKTRWLHGIAFQGWDRLGWVGRPFDIWMSLRDRRGPMAALVLAAAYLLLIAQGLLWLGARAGFQVESAQSPWLNAWLLVAAAGLGWRVVFRFGFTSREYGVHEGLRAVLRIPIANIISIMAGRRALVAYIRSLWGEAVTWDKTAHLGHPVRAANERTA